jgi:hypothetical protein
MIRGVAVATLVCLAGFPAPQPGAVLTGLVVDDRGWPLPSATVTAVGGEPRTSVSVTTGPDGRFRIENLPPGRFTASASKPAYVAHGGASDVSVAAGGVAVTEIRLARGGTIFGVVRQPTGHPFVGVTVRVYRVSMLGDYSTVSPAIVATTDDLGAYRAFGLLPGKYLAAYEAPALLAGRSPRMTASHVDAMLRLLREGHRELPTDGPVLPQPPVSDGTRTYAPSFAPGTVSPADALFVHLDAGDEQAVDLTLGLVLTQTLRGTIVGGAARPARITLLPVGAIDGLPDWVARRQISTDAQGRFEFASVSPGRYTLTAVGPLPEGETGWATTEILVENRTPSDVFLEVRPALQLAGRVVDVSSVRLPLSSIRVGLVARGRSEAATASWDATAQADDGGSFAFPSVVPGAYHLVVETGAGGRNASLRSAMLGGRDVLDTGIDVRAADPPEVLELTFSDQMACLEGRVTVPAGAAPVEAWRVVAFSSEQHYWQPRSRRLRVATLDPGGYYVIRDMPPGEYFVSLAPAATTSVLSSDLLRTLMGRSARVRIAESGVVVLNLAPGG